MAQFLYHARDQQGQLARGTVAAATLEDAGRMLRGEGKFIVKLAPTRDADAPAAAVPAAARGRGVRRDDVIFFAHQMAIMLETGVPISEALDCVVEQASHPPFRAVMTEVAQHVQAGGELSVALRKFPKVFPPIMVSLVKASEVSGTMGTMLERISTYMSKEQRIFRQVRGALMYPCFMLACSVVVTGFLLTFVLPRFAGIYASRGAALPAPTRLLLAISGCLVDYWYLWLIGAGLLAVGGYFFARSWAGRRSLDYLKLHLPVLRSVFTNLYVTRTCSTLGTMISAGVSLLDAVAIVKQVTNNIYFENLWDQVDMSLRQGLQLSDPLTKSNLIPRSVSQMIHSGEKSGRLGQVMVRLAEHTEAEFDQTVKTATQFIEPLTVVLMGSVVGFIAISLLLPIFNISQVVAGK
jgi:type IV pilus assembly protein PilC